MNLRPRSLNQVQDDRQSGQDDYLTTATEQKISHSELGSESNKLQDGLTIKKLHKYYYLFSN